MDNIIDKVINTSIKPYRNYNFDYFFNYSKNITESNKEHIKQVINDHYTLITEDLMDAIEFYFVKDIGNKNSLSITSKDKYNYVLYSLYMNVFHNNLEKTYINTQYKEKLFILNKIRPHLLTGKIEVDNRKIVNCNIRQISDLPTERNYKKMIDTLLDSKCPLPYIRTDFITDNSLVIIEDCDGLDTIKDAFFEVLKDIINQLKCINKYYYFHYIKPEDIGRSKVGFNRYFIYNFDSLQDKKLKPSCYNFYEGRDYYNTISDKDQIRTIINILSELYTNDTEDFRTQVKKKPFVNILKDLENYNGDDIHDYMLNKLLLNSYL